MKRTQAFTFIALMASGALSAQTPDILDKNLYGVDQWAYVDSLGNHRILLEVKSDNDAVLADIPWRLRIIEPEQKNIVVVDASTGKQVDNVYVYENNYSEGRFAFQPVSGPGLYYVYYLSYKKSGGYYPKVSYYPFESTADDEWIRKNNLGKKSTLKKLTRAQLLKFQAINELNSFYPMEIMATPGEVESLVSANDRSDFIVFTEDRKYPVRSMHQIPLKWIDGQNIGKFDGIADNGEYFTFQVSPYAHKNKISNVRVRFTDLVNPETGTSIQGGSFTCFNTEGIDVTGTYFEKSVSVPFGELQPLWIGVPIPEGLEPGLYKGSLTLESDEYKKATVSLNLKVSGNKVDSNGDNQLWRHSRLRWLNSTLGSDNGIVSPFTPLKLDRGNLTVECLGRTVRLAENGLPEQIISWFSERMTGISSDPVKILSSDVAFLTDGNNVGLWEVLNLEFTKVTPGTVGWKSLSKNSSFIMECNAEMDFDGNIDYKLTLIPTDNIKVQDIRLVVPLNTEIGKYMMGLGEQGGYLDRDIKWNWAVEKNQDGPWVGKENAGIQVRFRDINYERPLNTNFYQQKPLNMPHSWYNNGNGGINILHNAESIDIVGYSGERFVERGDIFHFNFNIAITPFKPIDTKKQWSHRFYHRHLPVDSIKAYGANTINIHHATDINPYINYPFLTPELMKGYVEEAHSKGMKVKFYYTLRELSNSCPELFALRSLGTEIFTAGEGGGYSWLREHLEQDYIAAWFSPNKTDAAIINSGVSRWHNYYVEGLNWLVTNIGIDGIYIDDLAFDRVTMKRMRKVLERGNPGTFLDLHSANQYNPRDGFANSANLYLEHMPYIDRLWFGEYFDYNKKPDFWMVEVAGIPYGVMGEMLQGGGNPWRGMLYGMTGRLPWEGTPVVKPIWDLWDDFEIERSEMIGYWAGDVPVKTGSLLTPATAYVIKGERAMISIATWKEGGEEVTLEIDWEAIGLDPSGSVLRFPEVEGFQDERSLGPQDKLFVPEGKGYLIIIERK